MKTYLKRLRVSLPLYLTLMVFGASAASAQVLPHNHGAETCGTYDYTWRDGTHTAYELQSGGTLGQSFSAMTTFDRLEVSTPNYADGEGGYTLSLYRWDDVSGSYQVSVSKPPVARKTFDWILDNSWVDLNFAPQPPGNYVWEISGKVGNSIGVWGFSGSSYFGGAFRNGSLSGMGGVDFASRFLLRCPESPTPLQVVYDGVILLTGSHSYAPAHLFDAATGTHRMWWTDWDAATWGRDAIWYSERTGSLKQSTAGWTRPVMAASKDRIGAWVVNHVADASVIMGQFPYGGSTYRYGLFFTSDDGGGSYGNRIGVAFSNNPADFRVAHPQPVISSDYPPNGGYGAGTSGVAWDPNRNQYVHAYIDSSSGNRIRIKRSGDLINWVPTPSLNTGLSDAGRGQGQGPDIAYNPLDGHWYAVVKAPDTDGTYDGMVRVLRSRNADDYLGDWEVLAEIGRATTGNRGNHNPGLGKTGESGNLYVEDGWMYVFFGTGTGWDGGDQIAIAQARVYIGHLLSPGSSATPPSTPTSTPSSTATKTATPTANCGTYDYTWRDGTHTAYELQSGGTLGQSFSAMTTFDRLEVSTPNYADGEGGYTLSLYRWDDASGSYQVSVSQPPIARKTFERIVDNSWVELDFAAQPPGNYVWEVSGKIGNSIGVWGFSGSSYFGGAFRNGSLSGMSGVDFASRFLLRCTGSPTPTGAKTATPVASASATSTRASTSTPTFTPSPTRTKTATPVASWTATSTRASTSTPTFTPSPTPTKTATPAANCGTYDYTWRDGTHTAYELQSGGTLGQSFSALTSFDRLEVSTPNYADGEGGYTLSLYRWDDASGSYQVSVSQPPIARKTFERIVDNSWVQLDFAAQPPGNYVWEVSGKIGNSIGVWGFSGSSYFGGAFRNGSLSGMSGVDFASRFLLRCPASPTPTGAKTATPVASPTAIATSTAAATAAPGQTFVDVPPDHWAHDHIESLYQGMFVAGCSDAPRMFCPENSMARVEAAVFVVRGVHIQEVRNAYPLSWAPPQPTADPFADVAKGTWFAKWVNQLKEDRYTAGCGNDANQNPLFCPLLAHTRAEATVFFLRMLNGPDFSPTLDPTRPQIYDDVPVDAGNWYTKWVYAAHDAGLIQDCEDPSNRDDRLFRPMADITRAEAACMMATAVGAMPPTTTPTPIPSPTTPISTPTPIPTTSPSPPPYPTPSIMKIKSITVEDYWLPPSIASWGAGSITVNFFWPSGCNTENCTPVIPPQAAQSMSDFYVRDPTLRVTAIIFGVPVWARSNPTCLKSNPDDFANAACAPRKDALDELTRFISNVASTYDGNGKFLIQDFVIMNEVNHSYWFNNYCGVGSNLCDVNAWVRAYTDVYVAAYDAILAIRPNARVMVPLDNHFDKYYDSASNWPDSYDIISGMTFLEKFNQEIVARGHSSRLKWTLAYHAYPPDMKLPEFTAYDLPKVTFGNIGVVMGWLAKTFPGQRASSEMQLTENGINALSPSSAEYQAAWLCKAFRNVLGTPGITRFSYHRFKDHPAEVYGYGLFDGASTPRRSWSDWNAVNSGVGYCGFENPALAERFIPLKRGYNPSSGLHWISSRLLPQGFHEELGWNLLRYPEAGAAMLYECQINKHTFLSTDVGCENQQVMGPVGYAYTTQRPDTVPLYRCMLSNGQDHLLTSSATCDGVPGAVLENGGNPLGYAVPDPINPTLSRGYKAGQGHWAGSTLPAGFTEEKSWALLSADRVQLPSIALYSCQLGGHSFLTSDPNCEGQVKLELVGRAYTERQPGTVPIYRCRLGSGQDHLITSDPTCEGWTMENNGQPLGYAEPLGWWYGPGGINSMFLNPP